VAAEIRGRRGCEGGTEGLAKWPCPSPASTHTETYPRASALSVRRGERDEQRRERADQGPHPHSHPRPPRLLPPPERAGRRSVTRATHGPANGYVRSTPGLRLAGGTPSPRERERERALLGTISITGWSRARPADRRCVFRVGAGPPRAHWQAPKTKGPKSQCRVTRLRIGSPASPRPRIVPVDTAACRAYRDPGLGTALRLQS